MGTQAGGLGFAGVGADPKFGEGAGIDELKAGGAVSVFSGTRASRSRMCFSPGGGARKTSLSSQWTPEKSNRSTQLGMNRPKNWSKNSLSSTFRRWSWSVLASDMGIAHGMERAIASLSHPTEEVASSFGI